MINAINTVAHYSGQGIYYAASATYHGIYQGIPLVAYGALRTLRHSTDAIASGTSYTFKATSVVAHSMSLPILAVTSTVALIGVCAICIKTGALKMIFKGAQVTAKASKTIAKTGARVGKTAGKVIAAHSATVAAFAKTAYRMDNILLNLGAIAYIGYQLYSFPQIVLIGAAAGFAIRIFEDQLRYRIEQQKQDPTNLLSFRFYNSHDLIQTLPVFEEANLLSIPKKTVAIALVYFATYCAKNVVPNPTVLGFWGGVMGYQAASFVLNTPLDALLSFQKKMIADDLI